MGFFDRFRSRSGVKNDTLQATPDNVPNQPQNENVQKLMECKVFFESLLAMEKYVAKSEYLNKLQEYSQIVDFFHVLKSSEMLEEFCKKNGLQSVDVENVLDLYENAEFHVDSHNEEYISSAMTREKEYLDNVLKSVDPAISLDEDQRRVVLTDEDYCLVIAGAGAGKTTTVAAKVKYLVDRKGIDPNQILVISYTNKAVNELKERIQKDLGINCIISTFHSAGNTIIHMNEPDVRPTIVDQSTLYFVLRDYFRTSLMRNEKLIYISNMGQI